MKPVEYKSKNYFTYKGETLHKGSDAYSMLQEALKTGKPSDMNKYDTHMREVNLRSKKERGVK